MEIKMKKTILALAALGTAFTFTACGDDSSSSKSSDLLSCDLKFEITSEGTTSTIHRCAEAPYTAELEKELDCDNDEGVGIVVTATKGTGCPSGAKKTCENKEFGSLNYYYDDADAKVPCEELLEDAIEIEDDDEDGEVVEEEA